MTTTDNQFITPPSTPRRIFSDEAYFPPRSHLVGLGLDFKFPSQSTVLGLEQCSAPRLGSCSSPSFISEESSSSSNKVRCPSYWSSDSSISSRSLNTRSGLDSSSPANSNFQYSPFANATSPSPRESDALSAQVFGLGLALDMDAEEDSEFHQASSYGFQCLASSMDDDERLSTSSSSYSPMFGFAPAPSYSYALEHTSFALLPSITIEKKELDTALVDERTLSSSLLASSLTKVENEKLDGIDPLVGFMNTKGNIRGGRRVNGEKKRKRKESSIFYGKPTISSRKVVEESEQVKRLKSSPALKNLSIFTHAAIMEDQDRLEKQFNTFDAFNGLCVDITGSQHPPSLQHPPSSLSPGPSSSLPAFTFKGSPDIASSSSNSDAMIQLTPSPSRTIDCTLLVSNMPPESPYPPTPSSSSFEPFKYSSTLESLESPSSNTFKEEIKKDICEKLSLGRIGMSCKDVNVFTTSSNTTNGNGRLSTSLKARTTIGSSCATASSTSKYNIESERRKMVVVVHTA